MCSTRGARAIPHPGPGYARSHRSGGSVHADSSGSGTERRMTGASGEARNAGAVVVVGGSGGIGGAVVRAFARDGVPVCLTYRGNRRRAEELAAEVPGSSAWPLDAADYGAVEDFAREVAGLHGRIGTLVYAAGPVVRQRHLSRVDPVEMRDVLVGDGSAFFAVAHAFLPSLRESRGSI